MNSYLKGAPCLVKGLIILFLNYCVSTFKFSWSLLPRSELTFALMSSGNFQKAFLINFTISITLKGNKIILHHQQAFISIKQGSNSVQDNVWKKYYVILLLRTLVIFFLDGHGFILKRWILINVPFIWGMRDIKWSWNLWHQDKPVRITIGWRRK